MGNILNMLSKASKDLSRQEKFHTGYKNNQRPGKVKEHLETLQWTREEVDGDEKKQRLRSVEN